MNHLLISNCCEVKIKKDYSKSDNSDNVSEQNFLGSHTSELRNVNKYSSAII